MPLILSGSCGIDGRPSHGLQNTYHDDTTWIEDHACILQQRIGLGVQPCREETQRPCSKVQDFEHSF